MAHLQLFTVWHGGVHFAIGQRHGVLADATHNFIYLHIHIGSGSVHIGSGSAHVGSGFVHIGSGSVHIRKDRGWEYGQQDPARTTWTIIIYNTYGQQNPVITI